LNDDDKYVAGVSDIKAEDKEYKNKFIFHPTHFAIIVFCYMQFIGCK
jgi:hypothetical protein